LIHKYLI